MAKKTVKKPSIIEKLRGHFKPPPPPKKKPNPIEIRLRGACKKDGQPFCEYMTDAGFGRVYLSDLVMRGFWNGFPAAEKMVILVEDISDYSVVFSIATTDKDGNWLTRMYCGGVAKGNSITVDGVQKLLKVELSQPKPNSAPYNLGNRAFGKSATGEQR